MAGRDDREVWQGGSVIANGCRDGTLRLLDLRSQRCTMETRPSSSWLLAATPSFAPSLIMRRGVGRYGMLRGWDVESGKRIAETRETRVDAMAGV
eukprot:768411-Hanusia_phi.AAC.2